ncbi:adenylate/guanylate cyclase domain-containing protein [uncultured Enterovirga sp.]|uniref:adenylate/guanylate cyclase domain-containing protein n=1 Tax=uncultured Enterovirga sp. TaxID=2026352 RepID=UPI0035C9CBD2
MSDPTDGLVAEIRSWIVGQGLQGGSLTELLQGFAERLSAGGLSLSRAYMALPTISPEWRAINLTWRRGENAVRETIEHDRFPNDFAGSPVQHLLESGKMRHRWRIAAEGGTEGYRLLEALRQEGHTDYAAHIVAFGASAVFAVQGVALTACSDAPEGFGNDDLALLNELVPVLALAAYRLALFDMTVDVLGAYLGHDAGLRILNGETRRGKGESVPAALMMADLAGFTAASETGGEGLIERLGEHLAAMVEPVEREGGEVLKFLGDGILAAFPIDLSADPELACVKALNAACRAIAENDKVNRHHPDAPSLALKVGLHRGEVFYGNVGAGSRLDFTVIGPAVNEAARLETLCGTLGHAILMSEPFARSCGRATVSLGRHRLRGVAELREIFALPAG